MITEGDVEKVYECAVRAAVVLDSHPAAVLDQILDLMQDRFPSRHHRDLFLHHVVLYAQLRVHETVWRWPPPTPAEIMTAEYDRAMVLMLDS